MKNFNKINGFTLVELIVVIAILGILATAIILIINPFEQIQKSNDIQRKNDLAQIQKGLEAYYSDHSAYPLGTSPNYKILDGSTTYDWGTTWGAYMDLLPKDANTSRKYLYVSDGQVYKLYASLERGGKDAKACNTAGTACSNVPASTYCGTSSSYVCNYGVSSPNTSP